MNAGIRPPHHQYDYVGRFAPSPSGPLHFGSLICALASYLHARQHNGRWLLRIEDVDTPRIDKAMSPIIVNSLKQHNLDFDGELMYQSERFEHYQSSLNYLAKQEQIYACKCSRREIRERAPFYDGHCRDANLPFENYALRWKNEAKRKRFHDMHFFEQIVSDRMAQEDPVLKRADGIYAYHLAVVTDDIEQGVTHIVRGADLLDTTPLHLSLFCALASEEAVQPTYLHIPVASDKPGQKLSKQHHAPPIQDEHALTNLKAALQFLGCSRAKFNHIGSTEKLIEWAISHYDFSDLPKRTEILVSDANGVY
ncbi:tRNA glutamyl-Q(34) synthetase GluQRS [Ningiella sp. W23]|uniref:tRNA glutamyl-Q(34) synthetase GluQRS n=1 Tax=Ningiella sp. W23 TaxID=3023715 RepID=UPI0037571254